MLQYRMDFDSESIAEANYPAFASTWQAFDTPGVETARMGSGLVATVVGGPDELEQLLSQVRSAAGEPMTFGSFVRYFNLRPSTSGN